MLSPTSESHPPGLVLSVSGERLRQLVGLSLASVTRSLERVQQARVELVEERDATAAASVNAAARITRRKQIATVFNSVEHRAEAVEEIGQRIHGVERVIDRLTRERTRITWLFESIVPGETYHVTMNDITLFGWDDRMSEHEIDRAAAGDPSSY